MSGVISAHPSPAGRSFYSSSRHQRHRAALVHPEWLIFCPRRSLQEDLQTGSCERAATAGAARDRKCPRCWTREERRDRGMTWPLPGSSGPAGLKMRSSFCDVWFFWCWVFIPGGVCGPPPPPLWSDWNKRSLSLSHQSMLPLLSLCFWTAAPPVCRDQYCRRPKESPGSCQTLDFQLETSCWRKNIWKVNIYLNLLNVFMSSFRNFILRLVLDGLVNLCSSLLLTDSASKRLFMFSPLTNLLIITLIINKKGCLLV